MTEHRITEAHRAWTLESVRMRTWLKPGPHVGIWHGPGHLVLVGGFWIWYPAKRTPRGAKRSATGWIGSDGPLIAIALAPEATRAPGPGPAAPDVPAPAPSRRRPGPRSGGRSGIRAGRRPGL